MQFGCILWLLLEREIIEEGNTFFPFLVLEYCCVLVVIVILNHM